ncbi:M15 family metallopeptidase [Leifsonia sp. PS1209]|nr:M15 family metallopeptidase [Leifsonia sp. PS1209]
MDTVASAAGLGGAGANARLVGNRKDRTVRLRNLLVAVTAATIVVAITGCSSPGIHSGAGSLGAAPQLPSAGSGSGAGSGSAQLGQDDGYIPTGETVALTDDVPAVTRLDHRLLEALDRAATAAADRDVTFTLTDGWRSERYQQSLFDDAVQKYGSEEEASKWVKRGDESKHVRGEAVDIATADAMDWLTRFGGEYGLCQVYANEAWHFELTADSDGVCPAQLPDGTAG